MTVYLLRRRRYVLLVIICISGVLRPVSAKTLNCYSCASTSLESQWRQLRRFFVDPAVFSESCDEDYDFNSFPRHVLPSRSCAGHCLWIDSHVRVFGRNISVSFRGCASDLLDYYKSRLERLQFGNRCVRLFLSDLYSHRDDDFENDQLVTICACHSDHCNGIPTVPPVVPVETLAKQDVFADDNSQSINCYSCISRPNHDVRWTHLWRNYHRTSEMTDFCDADNFRHLKLTIRPCSNYCVFLKKKQNHGDKRYVYARGCLSDMNLVREHVVRALKQKPKCSPARFAFLNETETATICICRHNFCNGKHIGNAANGVRLWSPFTVVFGTFLNVVISSTAGRKWLIQ